MSLGHLNPHMCNLQFLYPTLGFTNYGFFMNQVYGLRLGQSSNLSVQNQQILEVEDVRSCTAT